MVLDNNPASREAIITLINSINNFSDDEYGISSLYDTDNFRDAVDYISRNTLDIIIVNISSINLERYKEDCIQLRSIYSYAPILALSESPNPTDLKNFDYVGFDDILDINLITPPHVITRDCLGNPAFNQLPFISYIEPTKINQQQFIRTVIR